MVLVADFVSVPSICLSIMGMTLTVSYSSVNCVFVGLDIAFVTLTMVVVL